MAKDNIITIRVTKEQKEVIKKQAKIYNCSITSLLLETMAEQLFEYSRDFSAKEYQILIKGK